MRLVVNDTAAALSVDLGFNSRRTDPFRLKRLGVGDRDGIDELALKACGVWGLAKATLNWLPFKGRTRVAERRG